MKKVFVINPGSTSTKLALFEDEQQIWRVSVEHDPAEIKKYEVIYDQLDMRYETIMGVLKEKEVDLSTLDAVVSRGGLLPPAPSGAVEVNEAMIRVLRERPVNHHASNLGCAIAYRIAQPLHIPAYIYDPVTVDEMIDLVRITGLKDIRRYGQGHNLNMRAAALRACKEHGCEYADTTLLVAHLGGGISMSLHHQGRIVDMLSDDNAAFSPERAGLIPAFQLVKKIRDEKLDYDATMKILQRRGGLMSHLGTSDCREVEKMIDAGDTYAEMVYNAMALSVARGLASLSVVVDGKVDAIVLTGGLAFSRRFTDEIARRVKFLAPVWLIPGEKEMEALAAGAIRVLNGEETARTFVEP